MVKGPDAGNWIYLYRVLFKSKLWQLRSDDLKVAIFLLLKANYKKGRYVYEDGTFISLEAGQLVATVSFVKEGVSGKRRGAKFSTQQTRTSLKHLKNIGFINIETDKRGNVITLLNYRDFQGMADISNKPPDKPSDKPPTNPQQTPNNKGNKVEEVKEVKETSSGTSGPKPDEEARDLWLKVWNEHSPGPQHKQLGEKTNSLIASLTTKGAADGEVWTLEKFATAVEIYGELYHKGIWKYKWPSLTDLLSRTYHQRSGPGLTRFLPRRGYDPRKELGFCNRDRFPDGTPESEAEKAAMDKEFERYRIKGVDEKRPPWMDDEPAEQVAGVADKKGGVNK